MHRPCMSLFPFACSLNVFSSFPFLVLCLSMEPKQSRPLEQNLHQRAHTLLQDSLNLETSTSITKQKKGEATYFEIAHLTHNVRNFIIYTHLSAKQVTQYSKWMYYWSKNFTVIFEDSWQVSPNMVSTLHIHYTMVSHQVVGSLILMMLYVAIRSTFLTVTFSNLHKT